MHCDIKLCSAGRDQTFFCRSPCCERPRDAKRQPMGRITHALEARATGAGARLHGVQDHAVTQPLLQHEPHSQDRLRAPPCGERRRRYRDMVSGGWRLGDGAGRAGARGLALSSRHPVRSPLAHATLVCCSMQGCGHIARHAGSSLLHTAALQLCRTCHQACKPGRGKMRVTPWR